MSSVHRLIDKHCPEGVQFKTLGEVGVFTRGNGLQKGDLADVGVGAIHYGQIHTYYGTWAIDTKSFVSDSLAQKLRKAAPGNLVIATTSEDDDAVAKAVAWIGDAEVAVSGDAYIFRHELDPKYVSYFFQSEDFQSQKRSRVTGTKVRRISGEALAKIKIPVPPLIVQREVAVTLDRLSSLNADLERDLTAELEARRRQYQFYRDALLSFDEWASKQARRITSLGDIATFNRGTAITADQASSGRFPVVANGPRPVYYHADFNRDGDTVVVARSGANAGAVSFWNEPIFLTDAFSVHPDPEVMTPKFAYHLLRSLQSEIRGLKKGSGVPHVQVKAMDAIEVCVPSLDEQDRIVDILDRLDSVMEDLSNAFPAEITARRHQWGHYRDRLLTFKRAA